MATTPLPIVLAPGWYSILIAISPNTINNATPTLCNVGIISAVFIGSPQFGAGQYVLFRTNEKQVMANVTTSPKFFLVEEKDIIYAENAFIPV